MGSKLKGRRRSRASILKQRATLHRKKLARRREAMKLAGAWDDRDMRKRVLKRFAARDGHRMNGAGPPKGGRREHRAKMRRARARLDVAIDKMLKLAARSPG